MIIGPFTVYLVALTRTLAGIRIAQNSSKGVSYSTNVVLITSINISPQRTPIHISVFQQRFLWIAVSQTNMQSIALVTDRLSLPHACRQPSQAFLLRLNCSLRLPCTRAPKVISQMSKVMTEVRTDHCLMDHLCVGSPNNYRCPQGDIYHDCRLLLPYHT